MPRGSVGAPWGGDTPPSVTAQGDWGTKQSRQGEGAAALGEGRSSEHVVAAAKGEIFRLQPLFRVWALQGEPRPSFGLQLQSSTPLLGRAAKGVLPAPGWVERQPPRVPCSPVFPLI